MLLLVSLAGCGPDRPKVVPVSGKVTIDGAPVTRGTITIVPKNARPAFGDIGPDGRFTLTTFEDGDGCVPGQHQATVLSTELLSAVQMKWLAPRAYSDISTSDLSVDISGPTDDLEVKLTWKGEQPFVETFSGAE